MILNNTLDPLWAELIWWTNIIIAWSIIHQYLHYTATLSMENKSRFDYTHSKP